MKTKQLQKLATSVLPPLGVLACAIAMSYYLRSNPPSYSAMMVNRHQEVAVETIAVHPQPYAVSLASQGTVESQHLIQLIAQVPGTIVQVSNKFKTGEAAVEGEVLVKFDPTEYELNVDIARASLSEAAISLSLAETKSEQARQDWKRMRRKKTASLLALLEPQLEAARAAMKSAQAQLEISKLRLKKSEIRANFPGVLQSNPTPPQVGQYVSVGHKLGEIYADQQLKVRLPLSTRQVHSIETALAQNPQGVMVDLSRDVDGEFQRWKAIISHINTNSDPITRRQYAVANIILGKGVSPPAIGQFLTASVKAQQFNNVFVIPRDLVSPQSTVTKVVHGKLIEVTLDVVHRDDTIVVARSKKKGLQPGDAIVAQALGADFKDLRVSEIRRTRPFVKIPKRYGLTSDTQRDADSAKEK